MPRCRRFRSRCRTRCWHGSIASRARRKWRSGRRCSGGSFRTRSSQRRPAWTPAHCSAASRVSSKRSCCSCAASRRRRRTRSSTRSCRRRRTSRCSSARASSSTGRHRGSPDGRGETPAIKTARGGDGGAGRRPLGTQRPDLPLTSRLSAPYTGEPSSVTRGTGSPPEGLISARYVTYRVYAGYPQTFVFDEGKGLSTKEQEYDTTSIINEVRHYVGAWRSLPSPSQWQVTPETTRLLQHWRHHTFSSVRPFFCQVEAVETAIWLTEVAPQTSERGACVALKTLRCPSAERMYRFKREFRIMSHVVHPNLVCLYELGQAHSDVFFTIDVKPSNVLITKTNRVVLLDFGLAGEGKAHPRTMSTVAARAQAMPAICQPVRRSRRMRRARIMVVAG